MKAYRYSLGRMTTVCPSCHRRTFKPYVDNLTSEPLDPSVCGRCNREVKCAYHLSPAALFNANPAIAAALAAGGGGGGRLPCRPAPVCPDFIPAALMHSTLRRYELNPLYAFMASRFPADAVAATAADYCLGTASRWGGSAVFWQIDGEGDIRTGKVMAYSRQTGRRLKNPPRVGWVHSIAFGGDFRLSQVFFGTHLLSRPAADRVVMVESEKSAMILSLCARLEGLDWTVMACGGASALDLDPEQRADLRYKGNYLPASGITLIPDADMEARWMRARLDPYVRSVRCVPASALGLRGSADIADLLLDSTAAERRRILMKIRDF